MHQETKERPLTHRVTQDHAFPAIDKLMSSIFRLAGKREAAYCAHLVLAALFFSSFFLFGWVLAANTDLLTENYPMMLLAKKNFLHGSLGLWNPYLFFGSPGALEASTPLMLPENWPLFFVPDSELFHVITAVAALKLWLVGVASYRFYCAEVLSRRWALFASIAYQLSGFAIWVTATYVALSIFLYYTILLALIWTMTRRGTLANYLLLTVVTAMMLLAGNLSQACYALLGAGLLFLYRAYSRRNVQPLPSSVGVFSASCATALLISSVHALPVLDGIRTSTRQSNCCSPHFGSLYFLLARLFDTEVVGVNYRDAQTFLDNMSSAFNMYGLHWVMPDYFGVAAALLALWSLATEKSGKAIFWALFTVAVLGVLIFAEPFDTLARALLSPLYHSLSIHYFLPVGFCALAALGGMNFERTVRRGQVPRLTIELFGFGLVFVALLIVITDVRNIGPLSTVGSNWARLIAVSLIVGGTLVFVARNQIRRFATLTPLLYSVLAAAVACLVEFHGHDETFTLYVKNISAELAMFAAVAIVVLQIEQGRIPRPRVRLLMGGALLVLCLGTTLYPWSPQLQETISHRAALGLAGLGAIRFVLGVFIFFVVLRATKVGRLPARSCYLVFLCLLLAEQAPAGKVDSYLNANLLYPASTLFPPRAPAVDADGSPIQMDLANYRVNAPNSMLRLPFYQQLSKAEICGDLNIAYGIRSYGGYTDSIPDRIVRFATNWHAHADELCVYADATDDRFLDLAGVGYDYDPATGITTSRPSALSRIMLFSRFNVVPADRPALSRLKSLDFHPLDELVLQKDPGFESVETPADGRKLQYTEVTSDHLEVLVHSDSPAVLFFGDSFDPNWVATVNGEARPVLRANYNFMAVPIPSGASKVVLKYRPRFFWIGLACTSVGIATLLLTFIFWISHIWIRWRRMVLA